MKESKILSVVLHFLAGISVLFSAYGIWLMFVHAGLKLGYGEWKYTLICVAAGTVNMALRWGLSRTKMPPWCRDVLTVLLSLAVGVGSVFLWHHAFGFGLGAAIFAGVFNLAAMLIGDLCGRKQPGMYAVMGIGAVSLICASAIKITLIEEAPSMLGILWVFFLGSGMITAGANYNSIDKHMTRRGHSKTRLPAKVRRNNLLTLAVLYGIGAVVLLLWKPLANGLKAAVRGLVLAIGNFIKWILSLIPEKQSSGVIEMNVTTDMAGAQSWTPDFWETVFLIVVGIGLSVLIVISVKKLLQKLWVKLAKLRAAIMRWLRKKNTSALGSEVSGDYEDVTEELTDTDGAEKKTRVIGTREWKRDVRKFQKMPKGRERFVEGYRLMLCGSELRGAKLSPSDTPMETGEKVLSVLCQGPVEAVTRQAEAIVFSGREADTDTAGLEEALEILKKKN